MRIVLLIVALFLTACNNTAPSSVRSENESVSTTASQSESERLEQLLEDIWSYEESQFPSMAKSSGKSVDSLDRQLTDISKKAMEARDVQFRAFREALDDIDVSLLTKQEQISHLMQLYRLDNYISQFKFKEYRVPITSEYGFHSRLGSSVSRTQIQNKKELQAYKQMLTEASEVMLWNIVYMQEGLSVGHTQPKAVLAGYEDTISAYIENEIEQHPFYQPVINASENIVSDQDAKELKNLVSKVNESYQAFYDFFTDVYRPNAKADIAAKNWPDGESFYNDRVKYYTTTDMSAQEIHEIGLKEVARIREQMTEIVESLEFDGDINDFIQFLRTDSQFYAQTPEDLIIYASYISKQIDAELPKLFYKMPRTPYGVAPVPDSIAPKYTTGRYISPRNDKQPGYYWVNTYALDKRPLYAIPALTLHEAVPGHHFQISLAAEMTELPNVRRSTYISAFGEGWGLYSEYLGLEVGIYEDPYDDFGRLSYEMWRACRLVVDTGMHMFGWTRQEALDYMLENTALSEHNVTTEIDRYISWPAQALSYKIGEIKIKQLREKAETELGDKFDLRAFHDAVLAYGSVPLFVLEKNIEQFIQSELEK